jgi:hypothetical protein
MIISASFFQITLGSGSPLGGRQGKLTESPIAAEIFLGCCRKSLLRTVNKQIIFTVIFKVLLIGWYCALKDEVTYKKLSNQYFI